jgi:signal transduction histidine kinase
MQERAAQLGGSVTILSALGAGTTVTTSVELIGKPVAFP